MMYKQIKINIREDHHVSLYEKADAKNLTIAQYVREELNIDLKDKYIRKSARKKRKSKISYVQVDPKLLYHLSCIGNNINQIAKNINTSNNIDSNIILSYLINIQRQINNYQS